MAGDAPQLRNGFVIQNYAHIYLLL